MNPVSIDTCWRTWARWLLGLGLGCWLPWGLPAAERQATRSFQPVARVDYRQPAREFVLTNAQGWVIWMARELAEEHPALARQAVARLDRKLADLCRLFPPPSHELLRRLPIFLMLGKESKLGGRDNGGEYIQWRSPRFFDWLDPRMGGCLIIHSARNYVWLSDHWATQLLVHEFAHAWHLEQWPETQADILAAWEHARQQGLYENVPDVNGDRVARAYAAHNQLEYFAELSCAYFLRGEYAPFDRAALRTHDPVGTRILEKLWRVTGTNPPPVTPWLSLGFDRAWTQPGGRAGYQSEGTRTLRLELHGPGEAPAESFLGVPGSGVSGQPADHALDNANVTVMGGNGGRAEVLAGPEWSRVMREASAGLAGLALCGWYRPEGEQVLTDGACLLHWSRGGTGLVLRAGGAGQLALQWGTTNEVVSTAVQVSPGAWTFIGVAYLAPSLGSRGDSQPYGQVILYQGGLREPVRVVQRWRSTGWGRLMLPATGFSLGADERGQQAFDGWLDQWRCFWVPTARETAVYGAGLPGLEALEALRQSDVRGR
jgi:hypothetical protein